MAGGVLFGLAGLGGLHLLARNPRRSAMTTQYWLVKSEPSTYAWADFARDGCTDWTGVRNFAARNHLRAMRPGDRVLFYESGGPKAVVGVAKVARAAFSDQTAPAGEDWSAVELKAGAPLAHPVTLAEIKTRPALANMALLKQSRLSVQPVGAAEFALIVRLGGA